MKFTAYFANCNIDETTIDCRNPMAFPQAQYGGVTRATGELPSLPGARLLVWEADASVTIASELTVGPPPEIETLLYCSPCGEQRTR
jgi:hypothetical protein